jgi:hypothetical protein
MSKGDIQKQFHEQGHIMRKPIADEQSNNNFKKANRGTNDEMEILGLIIANQPSLRIAVLEKLKQAKRRVAARAARSEVKPAG